MKSKQLNKSWKALLSIVLSIALVLGLMPSLQNARNFASADESATGETEQVVADSNNGGGEVTEQAGETTEQSEEASEEQAGKGGETADPEQESTDAEQKATTDGDDEQIESNTADTQAAPLGSAATKAVKIVVKGLVKGAEALVDWLDQSEAIHLSGDVYVEEDTTCPPIIVDSPGLNLIIKDGVTLTIDASQMSNYAGIKVNDPNSPLSITAGVDNDGSGAVPQGTGRLIVYGAEHCAAIGGNSCNFGYNITIESCYVEAHGGQYGAGIGGGDQRGGENITINGGEVHAWGGKNAAGIGSGATPTTDDDNDYFRNITINGGKVYANGGLRGAGIGTGKQGHARGIYINENVPNTTTYVEASGGARGAGIGAGDKGGWNDASDIYITGGTVKAYGGNDDDGAKKNGGAGIGAGNQCKAWNINISGGDVQAKASGQGAGIGGGSNGDAYDITISGGTVVADATGADDYDSGAGIGSGRDNDAYRISITGGNVTATAEDGAGIGGGYEGKLKNEQYGVNITGGTVAAYSKGGGAGIGSGSNDDCEGSITISGSYTYVKTQTTYEGAGIGGGYKGKSKDITINGGTVEAKSTGSGSGIGSGADAKAEGTILIKAANVTATGAGSQTACDKKNNTGCAIGCGVTTDKVKDDDGNKRVDNVSVDTKLSASCSDGGTYNKTITPYGGNWAKYNGGNVNYSLWRDVKITNGVVGSISVGQQSILPEYGTASISSYDVTANYVSGTDWGIQWYKDGQEISEGPASYSITGDSTNKMMYLDYDGNADAGDYEFVLSCDGVASNKASYKVNKRAATITSGSATKVYDGTPLTCNDSEPTGFLDGQGVYVTCTGSQTDVGNSKNTFDYVAQDGTNLGNYAIEEGTGKSIGCGTLTVLNQLFIVTAGNYSGMYDGQEHNFNDAKNGTQVKVIGKNGIDYTSKATIEYKQTYTEGEWPEEWSKTAPKIKDAGKLYVKVQATATIGGQTSSTALESDKYTMEVTKKDVTLTSKSNSWEYDGSEHSESDVTTSGDGLVSGEYFVSEHKPTATGKITKVDSVDNPIDITEIQVKDSSGNDTTANYNFIKDEGTLTVTPKANPVTITTKSDSKTYDGTTIDAGTATSNFDEVKVTSDVLTITLERTGEGAVKDAGTYANYIDDYKVMNGQDDRTNCYTFAQPNIGTLTIEKRQVTLTSGNDLKVWTTTGDYAYNSDVTEGGDKLLDGEKLDYSGFPKVTEISYTPTDNTFTYVPSEGSKFNANNYEITQVYGKLMLVEGLAIIAEDQAFTYDGTSHKAPVTVVPSGEGAEVTIEYASSTSTEGPWVYSETVPTIKDAGTLYIKARATKGVQTKEASYTATVNKRGVIITSDSATSAYTGSALTATGHAISGDGFAVDEGLKSVTCTGSQLDVGSSENSFSYELNSETTKAENYNISEQPGTLTVTPCASTIAITTDSSTAAYNGTALTCSVWKGTFGEKSIKPSEGSSQVTLDDTGDILIVTCTGSITDVGSTQNTCTYRVERKTKGDDVTANYSFAETTCGTLTVTQRSVVINTASANKVYDGSALTADTYTITGDGFITGQDFKYVNIVGTITNVGNVPNLLKANDPYALEDGTNPDNYKITTNPGTLTVEKRKATVTTGSIVLTKTVALAAPYSGTVVDENISADGFVSGELEDGYPKATGKLIIDDSTTLPAKADNTVSYVWAGAGNPANYEITENLGTLKVIANNVTDVVASGYTGTYDGNDHSGECFISTTIPSDKLKVEYQKRGSSTWSDTRPPAKDVADSGTINVKVTNKEDITITAECSYTVLIIPRQVTLSADSAQKVYDGNALTCSTYAVSGDGFVQDEKPSSETNIMKDASTVTNVSQGKVDNEIDEAKLKQAMPETKFNNYDFTYNKGTLQVTKRPLVLCSKPIGITERKINQLTNFAMPDAELLISDADKDALLQTQDAYKQIASLSNAAEVYNELQAIGTDPVKYDGNNHKDDTVVVAGMGFASGETVSYSNFKDFKDAATYMNTFTVNWGSVTESNYDTKIIFAPVTIDKRAITFTSADGSKMYDGTALTNTDVTVGGDGFASGEDATINVSGSQTKVGQSANTFTYEMKSGTKDSNYDVTCVEGTLTVTISDKLNIVAPVKTTFDYTGEPQGEPATATIDDKTYTGTIWYSTDGGKTYKSSYPMLVGAGTLNVKAHVVEYGYVTSECDYTLTINAKPASEDDFISDVNQEDLNNAAEDFLNNLIKYEKEQGRSYIVKDLVGSGACAWIEGEFKATEDPEDMAKLQAAAPGKSFKYADVRLYVSLWDDEGKAIELEDESGESITFDKFDIGDYNKIPIRITYTSDMTNTQDVECLRVHNGEVNSLPQGAEAAVEGEYWQMGEGQQSVMIAAAKYSTYAAAYNVPGGDNPGGDSSSNATGTGSTGDNMNLAICLLGLLMSCCAAYALVYLRRRKDK